jgi:response regulator RpfG family c-di-GMP phosphodiesterase
LKALFICDQKEEWNTHTVLFKQHFPNCELVCAIKGEDALDYLSYEGPFALVIIECSIRDEEPTELARQIIEITGDRPIIFLGTKVMINRVDENLLHENELFDILYKPFEPEEFKDTLNKAFKWAKEEEFEQSIEEIDRENLLPMKIRNFYLFKEVPYDVYLELTSTKFIKIIGKNKPYTHNNILTYARKNIKYLYLGKDDYLHFLEDGIKKVQSILNTKNIKLNIALSFQIRGILLIHQYVRTVGVTDNIINLTNKIIHLTGEIFDQHKSSNRNAKALLASIPFKQGDFAEQSIYTAYLCEAILDGLGWKSELSRKKLGLASILQDSMLANEDLVKIESADDPNLQMFPPAEQKEFLEHPAKAAELAQYFQGYPEADFVIAQHHERADGSGFPARLASNKLSAHSCAFILASTFVSRFSNSQRTKDDIFQIISHFRKILNVANFKEPLKILEKYVL